MREWILRVQTEKSGPGFTSMLLKRQMKTSVVACLREARTVRVERDEQKRKDAAENEVKLACSVDAVYQGQETGRLVVESVETVRAANKKARQTNVNSAISHAVAER